MTDQPDFVYVIYIRATPERVWEALTDAELSGQYWGHRNVSEVVTSRLGGELSSTMPTTSGRYRE